MSDTELREIERLFHEALDHPVDERASFLHRECADETMRARVLELLTHDTADDLTPAAPDALREGPGAMIGRYKLLTEIGEGGFGVVYRAEQTAPVVREVALKVIKLGMDTREVIARFEAERQALALMDHPHIAKVLDGGATTSGRPYFVMELVKGVAITDYCERQDLSLPERLALFRDVCLAVQHAHQKGVIHRDIKPSNVLVSIADDQPVPKVIDFGIAKAMHTPLTERTLFTHHEQLIGTPAYMSPEQADVSALDIDTRTDIYSLGALLYEILTGTTPFDTRELMKSGLAAVQRAIREEQPARPSVRVAATGGGAQPRRLRGDLDWIVMKALEKDRARRYSSAGALADDIARHLANEPVLAARPSALYRARKFLARNRSVAAAVFAAIITLLAGLFGVYQAKLDAEDAARVADARAEEALSTLDFLVSTLSLADPSVALSPDPTIRTLLDRTARRVDETFADRPLAELRVRSAIGRAYRSLSLNELAEPHLRRAVELIDILGRDVVIADGFGGGEIYTTWWALTNVVFYLERADAFGVSRRAREQGIRHIAATQPELAAVLDRFTVAVEHGAWSPDANALDGAVDDFAASRELADSALPDGDALWPIVADTYLAAGYMVSYTPHEPRGATFWHATIDIQRQQLPLNHPDTSTSVALLASILNPTERAAEAEPLLRESLARVRQVHRDDELPTARSLALLGENLAAQGRLAEAEPLLLQSHATILELVGDPRNFQCTESFMRVIDLYEAWGREDDARAPRSEVATTCATTAFLGQWEIAHTAFPPTGELRGLLDSVDAMCGGPSFSAIPGKLIVPEINGVLDRAFPVAADELRDAPTLRATLGRLFVTWAPTLSPSAHADTRLALATHALELLAPHGRTLPIDVASAHAIASNAHGHLGDELAARDHAVLAWDALERGDVTPTWQNAAALTRVARNVIAHGLATRVDPHLEALLDVLTAQLGNGHRDTREAFRVAAALSEDLGRHDDAKRYRALAAPTPAP